MNQSNKICKTLVPTYTNFKPFKEKEFTGYKLVEKRNGNYYSIVSGMFRYKIKRVSENSYHKLYEEDNTETFNKDLINRLAVFKNIEDAKKALESYTSYTELAMLEVKIKGNLISGLYSNANVNNCTVVAGEFIFSVKEIDYEL